MSELRIELGEEGDPDDGGPLLLECLALIDPCGRFVMDQFVVDRIGPRGGLHPIGCAKVYRYTPPDPGPIRGIDYPRENGGLVPNVQVGRQLSRAGYHYRPDYEGRDP